MPTHLDEPGNPAEVISKRPESPASNPVAPSSAVGTKFPWSRVLLGVVVVGLAVAAGWFWSHRSAASATAKGAGGPGGKGELPPVPVVLTAVAEKDVPVFLDGLGTVQAFQTVTVRSRVDGQLQKIAFQEGQEVRAGDLLAQIDSDAFKSQVDQAVAKKGQDEALLANAQIDLKRYADLLASESVTQQAYDTQKALVRQLEASVRADEAAVESARVQLAYATLVSPIDGRVGIRQVDQGNVVRASDSNGIVVVTQMKPISLVFTLPEQQLPKIQAQSASNTEPFVVLAMDRTSLTPIAEGRLSVIDNQIDTTTGTIRIKATFPNEDLRLWPGQFVNARLLLTTRKRSPVVPVAVIQRGPEGAFAFVVKEDQTVEIRPVKVGPVEQGEALIESGLRPGEKVVVDGQYKLQRGSKVRPVDPASASTPGKGGRPERNRGTNGVGRAQP